MAEIKSRLLSQNGTRVERLFFLSFFILGREGRNKGLIDNNSHQLYPVRFSTRSQLQEPDSISLVTFFPALKLSFYSTDSLDSTFFLTSWSFIEDPVVVFFPIIVVVTVAVLSKVRVTWNKDDKGD